MSQNVTKCHNYQKQLNLTKLEIDDQKEFAQFQVKLQVTIL
jgi:hypothetical protein